MCFADRKRMSIVLSDRDNKTWLFCKGAEVSMMPIMVSGQVQVTTHHFTHFSMVYIGDCFGCSLREGRNRNNSRPMYYLHIHNP